jgi:hypothetical protein
MNLSLDPHTNTNTSHSLGNAIGSHFVQDNVAYVLKARSMEPEKQLLLANGSEPTIISTRQLSKHIPVATDTHATIEVLLETVFSTWSVQGGVIGKTTGTTESVLYRSL